LPQNPLSKSTSSSTSSNQINSKSVLVALLDSHHTELAEFVEKALLLQMLKEAIGKHKTTIKIFFIAALRLQYTAFCVTINKFTPS
jgi:hypothetical protein